MTDATQNAGDAVAVEAERAPVDRPMNVTPVRLEIERGIFTDCYDRKPFGFVHNLNQLDLFNIDSLRVLAQRYQNRPADYFVSTSAPAPGSEFDSVAHGQCDAAEALERVQREPVRLLLKRVERHDARFRNLLDALFSRVVELRGGMHGQRIVRLESAIFVTSAQSITPFHFDPEVNFFFQVRGEKIYHVYCPGVVSEAELESFYSRGVVDIGQLRLAGRNASSERVFTLAPGCGFHQPQNSPHWVETRDSVSISYTFVFETDASRARGRTRACNYYLRRAGIEPRVPGSSPRVDATKSGAMWAFMPLRRKVKRALQKLRGHD